MKRIILLLLAVIMVLSFSACIQDNQDNIVAINIKENSFKTLYDVDEQINLDAVIVTVKYKSGQALEVPCTQDMIIGFDTITTGDKALYILYNNTKSAIVEYKVVNKGNETVSINTSCRLSLVANTLPNATSYVFSIAKGETNIRAISFTIKSISDLGIAIDKSNMEITNLLNGWKADSLRVDKNTLNVLIYKTSGLDISESTSIATISIIEQARVAVVVSNIKISDGQKDYYLPNIK